MLDNVFIGTDGITRGLFWEFIAGGACHRSHACPPASGSALAALALFRGVWISLALRNLWCVSLSLAFCLPFS